MDDRKGPIGSDEHHGDAVGEAEQHGNVRTSAQNRVCPRTRTLARYVQVVLDHENIAAVDLEGRN